LEEEEGDMCRIEVSSRQNVWLVSKGVTCDWKGKEKKKGQAGVMLMNGDGGARNGEISSVPKSEMQKGTTIVCLGMGNSERLQTETRESVRERAESGGAVIIINVAE